MLPSPPPTHTPAAAVDRVSGMALLLLRLPGEILEEIFLRLATPDALACASATHPSFHHIITSRSFLRRFRKLHPPPLLGFANDHGFHPSKAPHPSAPLASALAAAADFTYSFVPTPYKEFWIPRDIRDGRVLLEDNRLSLRISKNLAVCDPLSRRYVLLPPIPENLKSKHQSLLQIEPILATVGDDEDEDETSFKVICFANYANELVAFVFSSVTQKWCLVASASWSSLGIDCSIGWHNHSSLGCNDVSCLKCIRGCFYSASPWEDKLIVLDTRTIAFFTVFDANDHNWFCDNDVRGLPGQETSLHINVVGREGALEVFSLVRDHSPNGSFDLYHTTQKINSESSKEWQLKNIVPLPDLYGYFIVGTAEGFLFLGVTAEDREVWEADYFSLEIQTSELKKICSMMKSNSIGGRGRSYYGFPRSHSYFGFPPSLSIPSI